MFDYQRNLRRGWGMSLATTLVVAAVRAGGAAITGSGALLAGALQAGGDGFAQSVLLITCRGSGARGQHSQRHPLVRERQRNFWPLAVGALLAGVGAGVATGIAVTRLGRPSPLTSSYGLVASSIAVATTLWRAVPAMSASWWHDLAQWRHPRRPEAALVTLQDALSVGGGLVVAVAVAATAFTRDPIFDTVGMLAAGGTMATGAVLHLVLMRRTVVGRGASRAEQQGIAAAIEIEPSVVRLAHLDTYHLSTDELFVAARVDLIPGLELVEVWETVQRLKASIRRAVPAVCSLYLEPDIPGHVGIGPEVVPAQVVPEIRPAGSDFEPEQVIIARETTNDRTPQEGNHGNPLRRRRTQLHG